MNKKLEKMSEKKLASGWEYRNTVLIRLPKDNEPCFEWKQSVIALEFDGVLVQSRSKGQSRKIADFELLHPLDLLKEQSKYASIVIISNQKSVGAGKLSKSLMQARFDKFMEVAAAQDIPCIGLFATCENCFAKPHTGLWKLLASMYVRNRYHVPDPKMSIYVGCNAGRLTTYTNSIWGANTKDAGYEDRAFASNNNLKFWTSDVFFHLSDYDLKLNPRDYPLRVASKKEKKEESVTDRLDPNRIIKKMSLKKQEILPIIKKKPTRQWEYPSDVIRRDELDELVEIHNQSASSLTNIAKALKKFESTMVMVLMIGPPGSGKSTLAEHICKMLTLDYKSCFIVSGTKRSCQKLVREYIRNEVNFIVDNCNQSAAIRGEYINMIKNEGYAVLMVDVKISDRLARHLSYFRTETSTDFSICDIPYTSYTSFNKKYEPAAPGEFSGELQIIEWTTTLPHDKPQFWMIY